MLPGLLGSIFLFESVNLGTVFSDSSKNLEIKAPNIGALSFHVELLETSVKGLKVGDRKPAV